MLGASSSPPASRRSTVTSGFARASFDAQRGPNGALLVGSPDEVTDKVLRHAEALGGISRISFQMNAASLPQSKMMRAIDAIGARVLPALHGVN